MKVKQVIVKSIELLIARHPFWEGLSILLLLGEIDSKSKKSKIDIPHWLIYVDMGILVILGTYISFSTAFKRRCAQLAAFVMVVHSIVEGTYRYNNICLVKRILLKNLGMIAAYLLIGAGFGMDKKARKSGLMNVACFVLGGMLVGQAYLFATTEYEQKLLIVLLPVQYKHEQFLFGIICIITFSLGVAGLCLFARNKWFEDALRFALLYAIVFGLPNDFSLYSASLNIEFWAWLRLLVSNVITISALILLLLN